MTKKGLGKMLLNISLTVVAMVAMATAMPQCDPMMPFLATPAMRLASRKMLEECIGKEHFDKLAMKMGSMLEDCMKKSPQDYLMGKIDISQIPVTGDSAMDAMWAKMPYRMGNFSCLLQKKEYVNEKGLDVQKMKEHIEAMFSDKKMKDELIEDVVDCHKFAEAMPSGLISRSRPPLAEKWLPEHVVRVGAFFHCFRRRVARCCHYKKEPMAFTPYMFLKMSRLPDLMSPNSVIEDFFQLQDDHPLMS